MAVASTTVAAVVGKGADVGGWLVSVAAAVAVSDGTAVTVIVGAVVVVGARVGVGVVVGVGGQVGFGVGFHSGPGVGVLPASGGESTRGANPIWPCTTTARSATQPRRSSASCTCHQGALALRPTMG